MASFNTRTSATDPRQGSAFNELVVNPTLAPQIARPYHVPGTPDFHAAQAALTNAAGPPSTQPRVTAPTAQGTEGTPETPTGEDNAGQNTTTGEDGINFFIHVTIEFTEKPTGTRGSRQGKRNNASRNVAEPVPLLRLSRTQVILSALGAHNLEHAYVPGTVSGPGIRVHWSGSPGGQSKAPTILNDQDWASIQNQIRAAASKRSRTKPLDTICIVFDLDRMEGFKNRLQPSAAALLDIETRELEYGTHIPRVDSFSSEELALAEIGRKIASHWSCGEHKGTCFTPHRGPHIQISRFKLQAWASAVAANRCEPTDPPPADLVNAWLGPDQESSSTISRPRGRTGPHPAAASYPSAPADPNSALLAAAVGLMVHKLTDSYNPNLSHSSRSKKRHRSLTPPSSPIQTRSSSPPPAISDELDLFLANFGKAKGISEASIDAAGTQLRQARYMPDVLAESSVTADRLKELTGLAEGEVHALKKHAREWSRKVSAKRAKRDHK